MIQNMTNDNIALFSSSDGMIEMNVACEKETVWLNLSQISELFARDKSVISRHIKKVLSQDELDKDQVIAFFATTARDGKNYQVEHFNLDMILSIGYRVNSKRGSEFRRWANAVLNDYILKGYALSQTRIAEKGFEDLNKSLELLKKVLTNSSHINDIGLEAISIIQNYSKSWSLLLKYDEKDLKRVFECHDFYKHDTDERIIYDAIQTLKQNLMLKKEASELFGVLRLDNCIQSIFDSVHQTFGTEMLYPSLEERAAYIFYFVIKNHPFIDGNKRIGSFLFLLYLRMYNFGDIELKDEMLDN
jgi:prophage maintenance system killer protein